MKKLLALALVAATLSLSANTAVKQHATLAPKKATVEKAALQATDMTAGAYGASRMIPRTAIGDRPDTCYMTPLGTFFNAPFETTEGFSYYYGFMIAPYADLTWTFNYLGEYNQQTHEFTNPFDTSANTISWYYVNPETGQMATTDGPELVTNYPGDPLYVYPAPLVTLNGAETGYQVYGAETSNAMMQIGGTKTFEIEDVGVDNSVSSHYVDFDICYPNATAAYPMTKEDLENGWDSNSHWTETYGERLGVDSLAIRGLAELIPYGGAPYALKRVFMPAYIIATAGGKVTVEVCPVNNGTIDLDNPLGTASFVFEEDQPFKWVDMDFTFSDVDEFGLEQENPITVTGDIALVIRDVYSDKRVQHFRPLNFAYTEPYCDEYSNRRTGYMLLATFTGDEETGLRILGNNGGYYWYLNSDHTKAGLPSAFWMTYDVEYPYIKMVEPTDTLEFAVEGEVKNFDIFANKEFENLKVEAPEWLTVDGVDGMESDDEGNEIFTGNIAVTATAEAATEYREGYITISTPAAELKIFVFQGEKGVEPGFDKGDVNGDGKVDGTDLNILINIILGKDDAANYDGRANVDEDANNGVDGNDLNALINILLGK
jgi:hypothetical protein